MDAKSRVALVTGASRGIGRAIAVKLAEAGIDVAIGYEKNQAEAEHVVQRITALGRRAMAIGTDLRDPRQVAACVQSVEEALGRIDILVDLTRFRGEREEPNGTFKETRSDHER